MEREKDYRHAGQAILRMLDQESRGPAILDRRMIRKIDRDVEDEMAGRQRWILSSLPKGYSWVEADGEMPSTPRVRTPDGRLIEAEDLDRHVFATDRSDTGRSKRILAAAIEGFRDSTRLQWLRSPERQEQVQNFVDSGPVTRAFGPVIKDAANLGSLATGLLNIPFQTLLVGGSQAVTEVQDKLNLPFWHYGSRPDDLWEAGGHAKEDFTQVAPVAAASFGASPIRLSSRAGMTKYHRDVEKALNAGYMLDESDYLAQKYKGMYHHSPWATSADIRQAVKDGDLWLEKFGESKWNKRQPKNWSRLDAYIDHSRNDKNFNTAPLKAGMQRFDRKRFNIEHRGLLGREWYSLPTRTKILLSSPLTISGGGMLVEEALDESELPRERD